MLLRHRFSVSLLLVLLCFIQNAVAEVNLTFVKQNSSPKYFGEEHQQTGLCDAIYLNMQLQLQRKGIEAQIDTTLYPIKRVLAMLENGSAHVFCGAGRNADRELKYHYSKLPVYAVSNVLLAHESNNFVAKDYQELDDKKLIIGAYFGTSSARFLKSYTGVKVVDTYKTLDDAMNAVAQRQIPYFYYHDLGLVHLVENSELPIKLMPRKFRTVDQWMIYSKTLELELVIMLDEALKALTDQGIIADINARFFN